MLLYVTNFITIRFNNKASLFQKENISNILKILKSILCYPLFLSGYGMGYGAYPSAAYYGGYGSGYYPPYAAPGAGAPPPYTGTPPAPTEPYLPTNPQW